MALCVVNPSLFAERATTGWPGLGVASHGAHYPVSCLRNSSGVVRWLFFLRFMLQPWGQT